MSQVLLIDDDIDLTAMLSQFLIREGFQVSAVHDGEAGVAQALASDYSIIVMDIMMPKLSGIEALRRIRASSNVPVMMLTARGDNIDRIVGLDMGADDYVSKPFTPGELVARIRAILRRVESRDPAAAAPASTHGARSIASKALQAGGLTLMPGSRKALWRGEPLELTGTEFSLLEVLARHAGQLISKQDISLQAFGKPLGRFDRRIDVHISSIRQKLGAREDGQSWIESVRGRGYQLLED
jgi:DNA-binding response OmpR family regulator